MRDNSDEIFAKSGEKELIRSKDNNGKTVNLN